MNIMYLRLYNPILWMRVFTLLYIYVPIGIKLLFQGSTEKNIISFKNNINKTGAVFIKLVQWVIQRPELLDPKINDQLKSLQNYCNEYELNKLIPQIDKELGFSHMKILSNIEHKPLGVGSIAQVHKAKLIIEPYGDVIIKIRHPSVISNMETDLTIIYWILKALYLTKYRDVLDTLNIYKILENIYHQCSLKNEKINLEKISAIFADEKNKINVKFPSIIYAYDCFIIETYCPGVHINQFKNNPKHYIDARSRLLDIYMKMIKNHYLHGDLHDGNVLCHINEKGLLDIYLVDFGIIINLAMQDNIAFRDLILGYMFFYSKNNPDRLLESIKNLTDKKLEDKQLVIIKDLLLSCTTISNGVRLFSISMLFEFMEKLIVFFKENDIYIKDNILYALITLSNIEAGISNEFKIDFFRNRQWAVI